MKLVIISGSQRLESQSIKVAYVAASLLKKRHEAESVVLDLAGAPLPFWTDDPGAADVQRAAWAPFAAHVRDCHGLVIVSPEWNGMASPALKNFFLYCTAHELTDKPGYIIGITSGRAGGAYPTSELRLSSGKDTQLCYIPEQLVIRDVVNVLNEAHPQTQDDAYALTRLDHGLGLLVQYADALVRVRASGARNLELFPFGM